MKKHLIVNSNVSITILDNTIFLHLKKHQKIILSAEDKYRKGIEINICNDCNFPRIITGTEYRKNKKIDRCMDCDLESFKSKC